MLKAISSFTSVSVAWAAGVFGPGRPAFRMIYSVDNIILCIILFVNTLLKINNYYWVNCLKSGRAFWLHDKTPVFATGVFLNV